MSWIDHFSSATPTPRNKTHVRPCLVSGVLALVNHRLDGKSVTRSHDSDGLALGNVRDGRRAMEVFVDSMSAVGLDDSIVVSICVFGNHRSNISVSNSRFHWKRGRLGIISLAIPNRLQHRPGLMNAPISIAISKHSRVTRTKSWPAWSTFPIRTVSLRSPWNPSCMTLTSMFKMSPS